MKLSLSGRGGGRIGAGRPKKQDPLETPGGPAPVPAGSDPVESGVSRSTQGRLTGDRLGRQVQRVYDELEAFARQQGTLIPATELEFRALCALVVIQRRCARSLLRRRVDEQWRGLERTHDSLTRRLETKLRSFRLAPVGEPMIAPQAKPPTTMEALKARRAGLRAV